MPIRTTTAPRVLVVDDEPDVCALLAAHLGRLGCEVTTVGTGEEALDLAVQNPPEVLVVDILLPGLDGRELVKRLRARPATAGCRVIAMSVLDREEYDLRADAVLPKPFLRDDVAKALAHVLDEGGGKRP